MSSIFELPERGEPDGIGSKSGISAGVIFVSEPTLSHVHVVLRAFQRGCVCRCFQCLLG